MATKIRKYNTNRNQVGRDCRWKPNPSHMRMWANVFIIELESVRKRRFYTSCQFIITSAFCYSNSNLVLCVAVFVSRLFSIDPVDCVWAYFWFQWQSWLDAALFHLGNVNFSISNWLRSLSKASNPLSARHSIMYVVNTYQFHRIWWKSHLLFLFSRHMQSLCLRVFP